MHNQQSPLALAQSLTEYWSPRIISQVDNYYVKVAKLKGEFTWHTHENEDEMFMILAGSLLIEQKDKDIHLNTGDVYVVPKGVAHNPVAKEECLVMLFESAETLHTGEKSHEKTKDISEQLKPL